MLGMWSLMGTACFVALYDVLTHGLILHGHQLPQREDPGHVQLRRLLCQRLRLMYAEPRFRAFIDDHIRAATGNVSNRRLCSLPVEVRHLGRGVGDLRLLALSSVSVSACLILRLQM